MEKIKMTNATRNPGRTIPQSFWNERGHESKIDDWAQAPNIDEDAYNVPHNRPEIMDRDLSHSYFVWLNYDTAGSLIRLFEEVEENPSQSIQQRLDNANRHFRRKAAEVLADEDAVCLLADMYESINIVFDDFDACEHGVALARLAAANFCEIGARGIYITEAGQRFIEALNRE